MCQGCDKKDYEFIVIYNNGDDEEFFCYECAGNVLQNVPELIEMIQRY